MTNVRALRGVFLGAAALLAAAGCFGRKSSGTAGGGGECKVNIDCASDEYCVSGVCAKPAMAKAGERCTATRDCATGLYCGPLGTCATGGEVAAGGTCAADAVCKPGLRCNYSGFFGTCGMAGTMESGASCAASADCLAGLLCGASKTCLPPLQAFPPYEGTKCADDGPFRVYFEVPRPGKPPKDFFRLPFPNDARVSAAGKLDMTDFPRPGPTPLGVDLVELYVDAWTDDFDGFSSIGVVTFRYSADIDFASSTADNVWLVDLTPGQTSRVGYARDWLFSPARTKYSCEHRMTVRNTPSQPLIPNHTYAIILSTAIKSEKGETPVVDPDMTALLAETMPADTTLMHAWEQYRPLRDWLKSPGKDTADKVIVPPPVAAAAVFTVQDAPGHMQRVGDAVAKAAAPVLKDLTLCKAGTKSPCDDGTPERACGDAAADFDEIHGRFSVPNFQEGTAPYETPEQGGGIVEDTMGVPKVQGTTDVCFALTVPKGKTAPATGWPLMVAGHGTGGSMRSFIAEGVAAKMATGATPSAVFGFDEVEHGARKGTSKKKPDDLVFNPLNPRAARDNFLQGAADVLQAFRVAGLELDMAITGAAVSFDDAKVTYFGHSQGSTSGTLAVAMSDAAPAVIFSGAGSFLTHSLLDKTNPVNIAAGMTFLLGEPLDPEHPMLTIFQSYFDRSDPLNYNPLVILSPPGKLTSKHVYMSWGNQDTYTPASTLNANGMSYGWMGVNPGLPVAAAAPEGYGGLSIPTRPVTANITGVGGKKVTAAMFPYDPSGYDGHFVALRNPTAIADWSAFVQSYLATGTPTVP